MSRTQSLTSTATAVRSRLSTQADERALFVVAFLAAFALYLPLRSIQWDLNGIVEAAALEKGGTSLFSPNHMLFRPIGLLVYHLVRSLGYDGNSAPVLQIVTLVFAALGVAGFAVLIQRMTCSTKVAVLASFMLATSWSYWAFSTDIYYITPAACAVIWTLVFLLTSRLSIARVILASLASSAAVLLWQANVFILPFFVAAIIWRTRGAGMRERIFLALLFLGGVGLLVGATYISVALIAFGLRTPGSILAWVSAHGSDAGGRPEIWGQWSIRRLPTEVQTAIASFVPVWDGLGLRDLSRGVVRPDKILGQAALLALCIIAVVSMWQLGLAARRSKASVGRPLAYLCGYALFLPFILWWDPFEPKWFVVANVLVIAALAALWGGRLHQSGKLFAAATVLVALIACANLVYTVVPRHGTPNPNIELARCFASSVGEKDAFVPTDWNWFGYAQYFFNYRGRVAPLKYGEEARSSNRDSLNVAIARARELGGHVYIVDPRSYSSDFTQWSEADLGLHLPSLDGYATAPGFRCNNIEFLALTSTLSGPGP